ncbi:MULTISPECIES: 2-amino-4-hydroxy-6-hydroxymethyldihydropteridine diphosphokinase [unclassified Pseudoalteromonas]|uniref:2-amino-4-hydroxy-6- hydroxymethyldihydropteridine diphosphokinase n=1 Tax=unclassified Pseudoalteromonas TaxID=194690 RepID=UPI001B3A6CF4|nr:MULTISPECIES: 2-amino-4-hydroxy-6-hydroxymethyldihydropteridine diphosphokinase [unclassified Pseudoalteromonas]MBQ4843947.1 2-amino-4-hydroxy-6-hydroxymethyldihydropteridine diphosphokinase [Pseudoalteromonas sp. MMG005]MBQ4851169.1 2-amino-4-hydroxy-6-hydroxymethyldihydropteridine diphosphokinase [Pseudoalteromonas sp. MMG012]
MRTVYIGLGANLDNPSAQLHSAIATLKKVTTCELLAVSKFYASKPMGPQDQPDYVNAVAKLTTSLAPEPFLDVLQSIELEQGRQRKNERWGARTLDLDILLFGNEVIDSQRLVIPHYGLCEREFVVYPLLEIEPYLVLPDGRKLQDVSEHVALNNLIALN